MKNSSSSKVYKEEIKYSSFLKLNVENYVKEKCSKKYLEKFEDLDDHVYISEYNKNDILDLNNEEFELVPKYKSKKP